MHHRHYRIEGMAVMLVCIMPRFDQYTDYEYPAEGASRIHMIWTDAPCWSMCWNGGNRLQDALRSEEIEFYLVQHPWMENDTLFGEPSFEMLHRAGFERGGCSKYLTYEEFCEKGYLAIPFKENWQDDPIGMQDFYYDPENHPLDTPTGKIEFYSTQIAARWPGDEQRPPVPHWIEESDAHHERLTNERGKEYPFLMVSNHPRFRLHAELDDVAWLREIGMCKVIGPDGYAYEPVWINPLDAGWDEPRCVNACFTGALRFGEKEDFAEELKDAEQLMPGSNFYCLNRPKRWIGGDMYDEAADEVIIGAKVELVANGDVVAETQSDEFGDYWFRQIGEGAYTMRIEAEGCEPVELAADVSQKDMNLGSLALVPA